MSDAIKTNIKLTSDAAFLNRWDAMCQNRGWGRSGFIREAVTQLEALDAYATNISARAERRGETEAQVIQEALQFFFRHHW